VTAATSAETATWSADYLVAGPDESSAASESPLLRTEFDLEGDVVDARAHVVGLGYGELYVNGERIGDAVLDPGWTTYDERVLTRTHDVTEYLERGANALGLWLGRGWFAKNFYDWTGGGSPRARLHLTVAFADGTTRTVGTGPDWRATASPVVENDLFDGETYDARREQAGWAAPGFDDGDWADAAVVPGPGGDLRPQRVEPMRVVETVDPEAVREHPAGPIVDFGQNLTGWVELDVSGLDAGETVTVAHAEALTDDGDLATEDLRSAAATDTYVASGENDRHEPRFTYHGFRYAQVTACPDGLDPAALSARVVHTDAPRVGEFACANEDLTRVQQNCQWGLRGNLHSVPTDCPQRDERFGWTGDGRWTARPRVLNFDMQRAFEKWSRDHDDTQSPHGYVADTVPHGLGTVPEDTSWAITRVSVPWLLYRYYGDERVLAAHYEEMRRYVDYWYGVAEDGVVPAAYANYGDWLAFENRDGNRGLPFELFNTATLLEATDRFARIAAVLGHAGDAATYRERHEAVARGFNDRFFDAEAGRYEPGTQAAQAVPLFHDVVPEGRESDVVAALVETVHEDDDRLRTGFLSTPALLDVLSEHGHHDLAYEVVSQPEKPGWVYMVRNGATTLWEHWDSDEQVGSGMNSLNHPSFASVSAWFVERLAGLRVGDAGEGHLVVDPGTTADLAWAAASVHTRGGEAGVRWEQSGDALELAVTVPWNATATVRVPGAADAAVTESGVPVWDAGPVDQPPAGVEGVARDGADVLVEVVAGEYAFVRET
jgi:alpha-L-rhamnosidase